jgi:hypothetical protein
MHPSQVKLGIVVGILDEHGSNFKRPEIADADGYSQIRGMEAAFSPSLDSGAIARRANSVVMVLEIVFACAIS